MKTFLMADNKNLRDDRDRSKVAGNEAYELQHIAEKMGVSQEEVRKAIQQVGNSREKVEEFLRNRSNKR
jgi:biotin operon repressor